MYMQQVKKTFFVTFLVILPLLALANSNTDDQTLLVPQLPDDLSTKCGDCPCVDSCSQPLPPPPSPPPPKCTTSPPLPPPATPPPPRFVYFTGQSPPPPPPRFVYNMGPPGGWNYIYPTDNPFDLKIYSGGVSRRRDNAVVLGVMLFLFASGILIF